MINAEVGVSQRGEVLDGGPDLGVFKIYINQPVVLSVWSLAVLRSTLQGPVHARANVRARAGSTGPASDF